jgi:folate-binding protein YgfZ
VSGAPAETIRGFGPAEAREVIEVRGEDRQRFVHGYVTADVKGLASGGGVYAFVPTPQGKIQSEVVILVLADRLWLDVPHGLGKQIATHLAKYVIVDRVEIDEPRAVERRALIGEEAIAGSAMPTSGWSHGEVEIGGQIFRAARDPRRGAPALSLWSDPSQGPDLEAALASQQLTLLTQHLLTTMRIEAGLASFGTDFDSTNFPQESGAESEAVSYTKGCYLGQEIIARLHYRGQAPNVLRGLRFEGGLPEAGSPVSFEGREAGRATSVAVSERLGAIGLSVLHRRVPAGARVDSAGEPATVVELPFQA